MYDTRNDSDLQILFSERFIDFIVTVGLHIFAYHRFIGRCFDDGKLLQ